MANTVKFASQIEADKGVDFKSQEAKNLVIENVTALPTTGMVTGQKVYLTADSGTNKKGEYTYDGSAWKPTGDSSSKLDVLTGAPDGGPYRMSYFYDTVPAADKVTVRAHTISMDNAKTKQIYEMDVPAMDGTNAGLYTKAQADAKVDRTSKDAQNAMNLIDNSPGQEGCVMQSQLNDADKTIVSFNTNTADGADGLLGQIYAKKTAGADAGKGMRFNIYRDGIYYGKGASTEKIAGNEIATKGDIAAASEQYVEIALSIDMTEPTDPFYKGAVTAAQFAQIVARTHTIKATAPSASGHPMILYARDIVVEKNASSVAIGVYGQLAVTVMRSWGQVAQFTIEKNASDDDYTIRAYLRDLRDYMDKSEPTEVGTYGYYVDVKENATTHVKEYTHNATLIDRATTSETDPPKLISSAKVAEDVGKKLDKAVKDTTITAAVTKVRTASWTSTGEASDGYAELTASVSETTAGKVLDATAGKALNDRINSISSLGRYLSVWDCTTGKPTDDPTTLPYTYKSGDYYIIGKLAATSADCFIPTGSTYTGAASTIKYAGSETLALNDIWKYDGTAWSLLKSTIPNAIVDVQVDGKTVKDGAIAKIAYATAISEAETKAPQAKAVYNALKSYPKCRTKTVSLSADTETTITDEIGSETVPCGVQVCDSSGEVIYCKIAVAKGSIKVTSSVAVNNAMVNYLS